MKKIILSACVALSMCAFVACSSNPAIEVAEEFISNPTLENLLKMEKLEGSMSEAEIEEFKEWCEEHAEELEVAAGRIFLK